jgi:hypothetical protein
VRIIATNDERFGANPPLFIDPIGNDDNDGLGAGANALKTLNEWCRRMDGQTLTASATVTCAAGAVGDFNRCLLGASVAGVLLQIVGASTDSGPGTVSTITAENPATNTEFQFSDTTGLGPVIADGDRIKITAGLAANIGAVGYVKGFGAGGITNPFTGAFTTPAGVTVFPAANDTYIVSTPSSVIASINTHWENQTAAAGVSDVTLQFVSTRHVGNRFTDYKIGGSGHELNANFGIRFLGCVFADETLTNFSGCFFRALGCDFKTAVQMNYSKVTFKNPMFRLGLAVLTSAFAEISAPAYFDGAGSLFNIAQNGYVVASTGALCFSRGVASPTVSAVEVQAGGQLVSDQTFWSPVQGARNGLTIGIFVFEGGGIASTTFASKNAIIGSTANIQMLGQTLTQFTACITGGAYCLGVTSGTGVSIASIHDITTAPSAPANVGEMLFGIAGATHSRGLTSGLNTVIPAGAAAASNATLCSLKKSGATTQTVGAALGTLVTLDLAAPGISGTIDNVGVYVECTFIGTDAATGNVVIAKLARAFRRVAGVLTAAGGAASNIVAPAGDAALVGAAPVLNQTGTSVRAQVTGVALITINWKAHLEIWSTDYVG